MRRSTWGQAALDLAEELASMVLAAIVMLVMLTVAFLAPLPGVSRLMQRMLNGKRKP